jgi:hypothetical protein
MAASALIKFTQGTNVGGDGEALVGAIGEEVSLTNVDNTDVQSWQIDLVYVDTRSSLVAAYCYAYGDSSTPSVVFTPDVPGSYRWVLQVWEGIGRVGDSSSTDIRVFSVPESNGLIVPPSQVWPLPLPDPRTALATAKPNEMNFQGGLDGWAGGDGLLNDALRRLVALEATPSDGVTLNLTSVDGAMRPNRDTTTQRDAITPGESMMWYNTTTHELQYYDGTTWKSCVTT